MDAGRWRRPERQEHLVIPRTPTANNIDAALRESDSAFFGGAANGTEGGEWAWSGTGSGAKPVSPLRSTEKAKSKSNKRAEWMQQQLKQRAGTLEKLEALLNSSPGDDEDDDLASIAHIDKDLIPKISRLRGDREELIRMCSEAVQELSRKEEQNRTLQEANEVQGRLISDLQLQMQELREQMERLSTASAAQQQERQPSSARRAGVRGDEALRTEERSHEDYHHHYRDEDEDEVRAKGRGERGPSGSGWKAPAGSRRRPGRAEGRARGRGRGSDSEVSEEDDDHTGDVHTRGYHDKHHRRDKGRRRRSEYSDEESEETESASGSDGGSGRRPLARRKLRVMNGRDRAAAKGKGRSSDEEEKDRDRASGRRKEGGQRRGGGGKGEVDSRTHRRSNEDSDEEENGVLEHTVSHLSSRCSDLELGKKLLCLKLASTTERLNNIQLQNKALLNAMFACSAHNAEVKTILNHIEPK